jgi:DNA-binding MarR family transcriptional regulator
VVAVNPERPDEDGVAMADERQDLLDGVVGAIPAWQVLVVRYNDAIATRLGVTPSDLEALFALSRSGPCTPGVLGRHVGLTTGASSRLVERLVKAGLVTRDPDRADRRRVIVTARAEALEEVSKHYAPLNRRLREHLERFADDELRKVLAFVAEAEASTRDLLDAASAD